MKPVGDFFSWISSFLPDAPYARILLWAVLAILAAAFAWLIYQRVRHGVWQWRRVPAAAAEPLDEEEWVPEQAPAHRWLEEADALAAQGRYAEAIHHLLIRSVEDIARRKPALVKPSVTSRELAAATAIPSGARNLFSGIARLVERSLFASRPVGQAEWTEARSSYADFAVPRAWQA
ncbi:DUF4129 domain-containing protein [Sphingomonas arenae]|nr:DUF4129 domain-containing protein [Sphingomonas arenae]